MGIYVVASSLAAAGLGFFFGARWAKDRMKSRDEFESYRKNKRTYRTNEEYVTYPENSLKE